MKKQRIRVLVAMSGGVDSSVAALPVAGQTALPVFWRLRRMPIPAHRLPRTASNQTQADCRSVSARWRLFRGGN